MRVLALTRYPRRGSTSRLRVLQYLPHLEAAGIEVEVAPLWPEAHLDDLYAGRRSPPRRILARYARRLLGLARARSYDAVWLESEAFPYLPALAERALAALEVPVVLDLDDAVFHKYDDHPRRAVRLALSRKIDSAMRRASLVVAGNEYIAARAWEAGARSVELLPTVVDLSRYPRRSAPDRAVPRVVWIGTSHNARYLELVAAPLAAPVRAGELEVRLVGAGEPALPFAYEARAWAEDTETAELQDCDIGIMPLPDTPFERGKCGYKLIQYMACELPVIASPVGVNREMVRDGVNGFLASSQDEWSRALGKLASDAALRLRLGQAGRALVEERYSLAVTGPRLVDLFRSIA
jgi:glycosyltransferase involved in cell wall biosynthesis